MKKSVKFLSIVLSILMVFTALVPASAASVWDTYWENTEEAQRGIIVQPGKNEGERNFSWYMKSFETACYVKIGTSADMSDAVIVRGEAINDRHGSNAAKVTVTGLEENTTYYYTCVTEGRESEIYSFTTDDDSFRALYMSDIHIAYDEQAQSAQATAYDFADLLSEVQEKHGVSLLLSAGDQATDGLLEEYKGFTFSPLSRSLTIATAIGNHDRKGIAYKYFTNLPNEDEGIISSPQGGNYYFTKGSVLFLVIDSNNASSLDHRNFIERAVNENPDLKWRVVLMHHDMYGGTIESREGENDLLRLILSPIFDEFNIDLVLTGHSHHYSISDVIYDGRGIKVVKNGGTIRNADGTVYMVSASVARGREEEGGIPYSSLISIGMEDYSDRLYNIIDFSSEAITVTTYERGVDEEYVSFTLTKDDDYQPVKIGFFRKLGGILAGFLSNFYGIYCNSSRYFDLKEEGYTGVGYFEYVF